MSEDSEYMRNANFRFFGTGSRILRQYTEFRKSDWSVTSKTDTVIDVTDPGNPVSEPLGIDLGTY
jgi:hypothetical protein